MKDFKQRNSVRKKRRWWRRSPRKVGRAQHISQSGKRAASASTQRPLLWYAKVITGLLSILITLGLLMYHPFFHLQSIHVSGLQRIDQQDFVETVQGIMDYRRGFVIPGSSYFFVDIQRMQEILDEKYPISQITIQKVFPEVIKIAVEEKISTLIYDSGEAYSYMSLEGQLIEPLRMVTEDEWQYSVSVVTSTAEDGTEIREERRERGRHRPAIDALTASFGQYPIVYDPEPKNTEEVMNPRFIPEVIHWYQYLNRQTDISVGFVQLINHSGQAEIFTRQGWSLRVDLAQDRDAQQERLMHVLQNELSPDQGLSYIDLRYGERVFWQ